MQQPEGVSFTTQPLPTFKYLFTKTRVDIVSWKNNCQRKAEEFANKSGGEGDFWDLLAASMGEKAAHLESFLRKNPDHYGAVSPSAGFFSQSSQPNPFRPRREEMHNNENHFFTNGVRGPQLQPLQTVTNGSVVDLSPESSRKRKAEELREATQEAKDAVLRMKRLKSSLEEEEVTAPPQEKTEEKEKEAEIKLVDY